MVQRSKADLGRWVSQEQCQSSPQCKGGPAVETVFARLDTLKD